MLSHYHYFSPHPFREALWDHFSYQSSYFTCITSQGFLLSVFNITSLWPTSFMKSAFQNEQTNKQTTARPITRAGQRVEFFMTFRNILTNCARNAAVSCFSVLAVWDNRWLSDCLLFCDFRAVDLASVSLRNPPITQLSVSSLRISALLLSHVPKEMVQQEGWRKVARQIHAQFT